MPVEVEAAIFPIGLCLRFAQIVQERGPAEGRVGFGEALNQLVERFKRVMEYVQVVETSLINAPGECQFGEVDIQDAEVIEQLHTPPRPRAL